VSADRKFVHDMKNQIGIVIGYANLLLDEMPADDARRGDLEEIRKAGETALSLIEAWDAAPPGEELR
jgi:signal transduction histidine kinase